MKSFKLIVLAIAMLASGAIAADDVTHKAKFRVIVDGDGSGSDSTMIWSGDEAGFDLQDLAVGETKTLTGDAGEVATVTRSEAGFTFNVAGESIEIPHLDMDTHLDMDRHSAVMKYVSIDGMDHDIEHDIDVEMVEDSLAMTASEGIVIISPDPLDSSVRESIKSVLASAGKSDEVTFVDDNQQERRVMVIRKEVEKN